MNAPTVLLTLLTCFHASLAIATTQPPVDPKAATSLETKVDNDPLAIISISDEEKHYIEEECRRFAIDDSITPDDLPDYMTSCSDELTIAVKTALLQRILKKERQTEAIRSGSNSENKPKPM